MFDAGALTFQEFGMQEPLPLATIQRAVLEFLQGRQDVVVFGAQAVNAYVSEPRMTQNIDLLSGRPKEFAKELRDYLYHRFHFAVRVRKVGQGQAYRLFQLRKSGNRQLVYVRMVEKLPRAQRIGEMLVIDPVELIAQKVIAYQKRQGRPKSGTDWRDLAMLLLRFPELKCDPGPVTDSLRAFEADAKVLNRWKQLAAQEILPEPENEEF